MQRILNAVRSGRAPALVAASWAAAIVLVLSTGPGFAIEGPAFDGKAHHGPGAHALTNVRIVQAPGRVVDNGTLVMRDGVIVAVGADVEAPSDAKVWDLEGATLYPGLIESFATFEVPEPEAGDEPAAGLHPNPLVRPERQAAAHANNDGLAKKLRSAGFTAAVLVPKQGMFRGQSVAVATGDGGVGPNLLRDRVAQNVRFRTLGFGAGYPTSIMGAMALLRQVTSDARWHAAAHAAHEADPSQSRPVFNASLAALGPATRREQRVVFEARDVDRVLQIADLASELEFDALVVGNGDEYQRLDEVAATGLTFLLPVKFPGAPNVPEDDDLSVGLGTLRHWKQAPENPLRLQEAGVSFVFTSHELNDPKKIHEHLATAIERGFDADAALAALTTGPAELFGLDETLGTLDAGKAAHVVVTEGDLFAEKTKIRDVWVDGKRFALKDVQPPSVEPLGTWEVVIKAGGGFEMPATVVLTGSIDDLGGSVDSAQGTLPIASAEVSGDTVYVEVDMAPSGTPGMLTFEMKIDGENTQGSGTSPMGEFTFTGSRISKPEADPEVIQ
ncbi:MAG: amidohydrolase family protein [Thermoanaerobaculia bacterium]|nr:amidohydrolase family protein [Thermoanaerobaculia bacterium]